MDSKRINWELEHPFKPLTSSSLNSGMSAPEFQTYQEALDSRIVDVDCAFSKRHVST